MIERHNINCSELAAEMTQYFDRLWPLKRSITGDGVRQTHDILSEIIPLTRTEVPSGTKVFDWNVPKEWIVRDAYVIDPNGNRILDINENNLHLLGYSTPFQGRMSLNELSEHFYSLPDQPDAIPYVTSYYRERWGFCLSQNQRGKLPQGDYDVVVDTELVDGSMTLSEAILRGESTEEILFSTYTCHPSLANNELSGPLVAAFLYRLLASMPQRKYTYRFVFLAETIGSISYLSQHSDHFKDNLKAGYVVSCVGTDVPFTYKRSRQGESLADRAAIQAARHISGDDLTIIDFDPADGSDERQYCSPGFDLPIGSLMRSVYGTYPEYHTSLDNRDLMSFEAMAGSVSAYYEVCRNLELNGRFKNLIATCEPQLGKRGLYPTIGGGAEIAEQVGGMLWVLNYSDGHHDLLDIAAKSGLEITLLTEAAEQAVSAGILERLS